MYSLIGYYRDFKDLKRIIKEIYNSRFQKIKIFNTDLGNSKSNYEHWLYQFIVNDPVLKNKIKNSVTIFSVNGERKFTWLIPGRKKIFFTIENVHVPYSHWQKFEDLFLNDESVSLSLGFDYLDSPSYLRFPYWIMTNFHPNSNEDLIRLRCLQLNRPTLQLTNRSNFCSLICRKDYFGDREFFYRQVNNIDNLHCDGEFRNNNNVLKSVFNNNKTEFLKTYKFNLCPENSNANGYVTEKIFDAINSGCIPIYWGSQNSPELNILNQNAIIFLDPILDNSNSLNLIESLHYSSDRYFEFANQGRLIPYSEEVIIDYFSNLRRKLIDILD